MSCTWVSLSESVVCVAASSAVCVDVLHIATPLCALIGNNRVEHIFKNKITDRGTARTCNRPTSWYILRKYDGNRHTGGRRHDFLQTLSLRSNCPPPLHHVSELGFASMGLCEWVRQAARRISLVAPLSAATTKAMHFQHLPSTAVWTIAFWKPL